MKKKSFRVRLFGMLPCSAEMTVEAASEDEAREYAENNSERADWSGADQSRPDGCTVEIGSVEEL